jgi:hypothetical protein
VTSGVMQYYTAVAIVACGCANVVKAVGSRGVSGCSFMSVGLSMHR